MINIEQIFNIEYELLFTLTTNLLISDTLFLSVYELHINIVVIIGILFLLVYERLLINVNIKETFILFLFIHDRLLINIEYYNLVNLVSILITIFAINSTFCYSFIEKALIKVISAMLISATLISNDMLISVTLISATLINNTRVRDKMHAHRFFVRTFIAFNVCVAILIFA